MKKLICIPVVICLLLSSCFAYGENGSSSILEILPELSVESLEYLRDKIDDEIKKRKEESVESAESVWVYKAFVDSFQQPTDTGYITTKSLIQGTFKNSATNGSDLIVKLLIQKDNYFEIMLWEYGKYKADYVTYFRIIVRDYLGNDTVFNGSAVNKDRLRVDRGEVPKLLDILRTEHPVSMYIEDVTYYRSSYLFSFETTGFNNAYNSLIGE